MAPSHIEIPKRETSHLTAALGSPGTAHMATTTLRVSGMT